MTDQVPGMFNGEANIETINSKIVTWAQQELSDYLRQPSGLAQCPVTTSCDTDC
jgi:hypothetical protein